MQPLKYFCLLAFLFTQLIANAATFDNILKAIFYEENNESYIILHESLYHVTAGAYEQGNVRSQGYNSSRITVYNLSNGQIVVQKEMGRMDSISACLVLGCTPDNLWIYSQKYKSGLQSLNPLTLRRNISQAKIYSSLNASIGRFKHPNWYNINDYYGFDEIQQKLIITNTNNQQYYIDANTFATEPIKESILLNNELNKYLTSEVYFKDSLWELDGYDFTNFKCGVKQVSKPSFLYGQFLLEQSKTCLFKHFYNQQEELVTQTKELSESEKQIIENAQSSIKDIIEGKKPNEVLLQSDQNSFYVFSKSSQSADALIKISKVESMEFGNFKMLWSAEPMGMFYNVAQARNTPKFKKHFGDIYPEFEYKFIQICDDKLLIIYLLYMSCIDVNTGTILWNRKLN